MAVFLAVLLIVSALLLLGITALANGMSDNGERATYWPGLVLLVLGIVTIFIK